MKPVAWLLAAGLAFALAACATTGPAPAADDHRIRSRADLQAYLDAFNARRYDEEIAYYAPDVRYSVGDLTLTSPEQIKDFYSDFHDYVREHVEIARFALDGDTAAVVMPTRFEAYRTYDKNGLTFEDGSVRETVSFIVYELDDGKIRRIYVARYPGTAADFE